MAITLTNINQSFEGGGINFATLNPQQLIQSSSDNVGLTNFRYLATIKAHADNNEFSEDTYTELLAEVIRNPLPITLDTLYNLGIYLQSRLKFQFFNTYGFHVADTSFAMLKLEAGEIYGVNYTKYPNLTSTKLGLIYGNDSDFGAGYILRNPNEGAFLNDNNEALISYTDNVRVDFLNFRQSYTDFETYAFAVKKIFVWIENRQNEVIKQQLFIPEYMGDQATFNYKEAYRRMAFVTNENQLETWQQISQRTRVINTNVNWDTSQINLMDSFSGNYTAGDFAEWVIPNILIKQGGVIAFSFSEGNLSSDFEIHVTGWGQSVMFEYPFSSPSDFNVNPTISISDLRVKLIAVNSGSVTDGQLSSPAIDFNFVLTSNEPYAMQITPRNATNQQYTIRTFLIDQDCSSVDKIFRFFNGKGAEQFLRTKGRTVARNEVTRKEMVINDVAQNVQLTNQTTYVTNTGWLTDRESVYFHNMLKSRLVVIEENYIQKEIIVLNTREIQKQNTFDPTFEYEIEWKYATPIEIVNV